MPSDAASPGTGSAGSSRGWPLSAQRRAAADLSSPTVRDPDLAQAVARLRAIAHGAPWRPVRDRCRRQEGRA